MIEVVKARRLLKALGEDNRLRIVNLLHEERMSVADLCQILDSTQSNISKHLARLRLTGIVSDKREGQFVYYYLKKPTTQFHQDLMNCVISGLSDSEIVKRDLDKLRELKAAQNKNSRKKKSTARRNLYGEG